MPGTEAELGGSCHNPGKRWQGFDRSEKVLGSWPEQLKEQRGVGKVRGSVWTGEGCDV